MRLHELSLKGTTDASGDLTVDAEIAVIGRLYAVQWVDGTFDDGVNAVLSVQNAGGQGVTETLLTLNSPLANADKTYYPRTFVHSEAGAALTGTSGGDRDLMVMVGKPRLVVSSGGNAKTGGCVLFYFDRS